MAETTWDNGRKVCSRGCGRLVHSEHQQFPGVCLDCAQPALKQMAALTQDLIKGRIDVHEHAALSKAVTLDTPVAEEA